MVFIDDVHLQMANTVTDARLQPFVYLLSKRLMEGSTCLELNENGQLKHEVIQELPDALKERFNKDTNPYKVFVDATNPWLTTSSTEKRPFILDDGKLYIYRFFDFEERIINRIKTLKNSEADENFLKSRKALIENKDIINSNFLSTPDDTADEDVSDWQLAAAIQSFKKKFMIITGGPGTGKTTTIKKIIGLFNALLPDTKIALAAPTGKAANRMKQTLFGLKSAEPVTIHRLLGLSQFNIKGKFNEKNKLDYDLVIVDEASMIDTSLFLKLMNAIRDEARLILLGDKNQLASIEVGSLLGDFCSDTNALNKIDSPDLEFINSIIGDDKFKINESHSLNTETETHLMAGHIIELRLNHRFRNHPRIGKFSRAVLAKDTETIKSMIVQTNDESLLVDTDYSGDFFEKMVNKYIDFIKEDDNIKALEALNTIKVLCAVREGDEGIYKINTRIENYLKQKVKDPARFSPNKRMYHNRPIMVTKNYHNLELYNGDIGLVRLVDNELKALFLDENNNLRTFNPALIPEVETVFAMTIHKSQGSEFDNVLIILPTNEDNKLLTKELIYTAVTRAKSKVAIQGTENIILDSVEREIRRSSGIANRLINL